MIVNRSSLHTIGLIRGLSQKYKYDTHRALDALENDPYPELYKPVQHGKGRYVIKAADDNVEILYEVRISGDVVLVDISETWRTAIRAILSFYPASD